MEPSGIFGLPKENGFNASSFVEDPSMVESEGASTSFAKPDPSFASPSFIGHREAPTPTGRDPSIVVGHQPTPTPSGRDPSTIQYHDAGADDDGEEVAGIIESSVIGKIEQEGKDPFVQSSPSDDPKFSLPKPAEGPSPSVVAKQGVKTPVNFRPTQDEGGSFSQGGVREVTLVGDAEDGKEVPLGSRISLSAFESTLPMAFDNERFFDSGSGYYELLKQATAELKTLGESNSAWREPTKEMGLFGYMWRSIVKFLMFLTGSNVNRIMFTRGVQENFPFQTTYEAFVLSGVVRAFDGDKSEQYSSTLALAFKNRNTSRVLVQFLFNRWDWFWHNGAQLRFARFFDFLSLFPFLGFFGFTATENFPNTTNHAFRAIIRPLFEGSWLTRFVTGQQGIKTLNPDAPAQNLAAESTAFETAGRNQVGTFHGRNETNAFRFEHRLPTDESIFRTFIGSPTTTMLNNGVEHVLRCLAKHYRNMLYQENGNFAHQRMEQLNPFEFLRFHMPLMLLVLANLRGRNVWDMQVLGPFVRRLQSLNPGKIRKADRDVEANHDAEIYGPVRAAQGLVEELKEAIVPDVCGGVKTRMEPMNELLDALDDALSELGREAEVVRRFVLSAETGIKLGYQILKLVDWSVPSMRVMENAIKAFAKNKFAADSYHGVSSITINTALQKLSPKDERSLKELLTQGHGSLDATKLLLGRASTLLERELRRNAMDDRIRMLSLGSKASASSLEQNKWYWLMINGTRMIVLFKGTYGDRKKFIELDSRIERVIDESAVEALQYIPVAEAIARAQKAAMTIELDHGKRFQYNAFMEFGSSENSSSLRTLLRRLITVAQMFSYELDRARLSILTEVKNSVSKVKKSAKYASSRLTANCKPQNVTVIGGGPTGLLCGVHCIHNVLLTGGKVRVLESRDAFVQEGSNFERAQIVRLDARQISMLRYHLGTGFEDVYIPARGETDPHLGNTVPNQGFVEVTIKRLESAILDEVINLRSKGLLDYFSDTKINYDQIKNVFSKKGDKLKPGDIVFDPMDAKRSIEITGVKFAMEIRKEDLKEGSDYDLILPREKKQRTYRLQKADHQYDFFQFVPHQAGSEQVAGPYGSLPAVFKVGEGRTDPVEYMAAASGKEMAIPFDNVKNTEFTVDFSSTHVVLATGKPASSKVHFYTTTSEPYAVCCIEGIKISYGMHNFGEKRWGAGVIDDIRSHTDMNTRVIGDFTKSVVLRPVVERMRRKMAKDKVWQEHFKTLPDTVDEKYNALDKVILREVEDLAATQFRRERLQTRFFELGNNYYLGMEFAREFDLWKANVTNKVAPPSPDTAPDSAKKVQKKFAQILPHNLDRLWYEACLEIIAEGDVYNPGGRSTIPALYTIDSPFEQKLGSLENLDSFRLFSKRFRLQDTQSNGFALIQSEHDIKAIAIPSKTYVLDLRSNRKRELADLAAGDLFEPIDLFEIISKGSRECVVRTSRGHISTMKNSVRVGRASDVSRAPNGYSESKVGLASFPVAHVVCHRTLRLNRIHGKGGEDGFITAYVGDAQASPHFMRYSGLTGACINCMSINNLVGEALAGVSVMDRIQRYAFETFWSNGEVVQRGTGANYGEDGFLRPGFPYRKLVDFLYGRASEHFEIGADTAALVSRDWKIKLAAAIVPRGLENDGIFYKALLKELEQVLRAKFEDEVGGALSMDKKPKFVLDWNDLLLDHEPLEAKMGDDLVIAKTVLLVHSVAEALKQTIDYSLELRQDDKRVSSELFNQSKSVDSITDDFAVEAQNFANGLTQASALTSGSVALGLVGTSEALVFAALLGVWNIGVSFGSMTEVSRYRNRNEETRKLIVNQKYGDILRNIFILLSPEQRSDYPVAENPFLNDEGIGGLAKKFICDARYYDQEDWKIDVFIEAHQDFQNGRGSRHCAHAFMRRIAGEFIPKVFYVNSYLQESLVKIYRAVDEMLELETQNADSLVKEASTIFISLRNVQGQLQKSAQLGHIYFGFIRQRPILETAVFAGFQYLLGPLLWLSYAQKTGRILRMVKKIEKRGGAPQSLKRAGRDIHELYHSTQESRIAAIMFTAAFLVFWFSLFFTFVRLVEFASSPGFDNISPLTVNTDILTFAPWAALGTLTGAAAASFHFLRKMKHLFTLDWVLARSARGQPGIRLVRAVTWTQILLTFVRLGAATLAAISLPWTIVVSTLIPDGDTILPAQLATASVVSSIGSAFFFFGVEFLVRYNLAPRLGETVLGPLKGRIMEIKGSFTKAATESIDTKQRREREAWEYTAREFFNQYRFDTVFAGDRFGTLLQTIQGGMDEEKKVV